MPIRTKNFKNFLEEQRDSIYDDAPFKQFAKEVLDIPEIERKGGTNYFVYRRVFLKLEDQGQKYVQVFKQAWALFRKQACKLTAMDLHGVQIRCPVKHENVFVRNHNHGKQNIDIELVETRDDGTLIKIHFRCQLCGETHTIHWNT